MIKASEGMALYEKNLTSFLSTPYQIPDNSDSELSLIAAEYGMSKYDIEAARSNAYKKSYPVGINFYITFFKKFITNESLNVDENKFFLSSIIDKFLLSKNDIENQNQSILNDYIESVLKNNIITDKDLDVLKSITDFSNLDISQSDGDRIKYAYTIWRLSNGSLPLVDWSATNIIPKRNEILHYFSDSAFCKNVRHSSGVSYSGITGSFDIYKGVKYRAGSLKLDRNISTSLEEVDYGFFWISNMRIGYIGDEQSFTIQLNKITSITDNDAYLFIYTENAQKPKIISLSSYSIPCAILSILTNK